MVNKIFCSVVFLFLLLPFLVSTSGRFPNKEIEKAWTLKYSKPETKTAIRGWINYLDEQYSKSFPGRSLLYSLSTNSMFRITGQSLKPEKVRAGKEGFMFLGSSFRDHFLMSAGLDSYSDKESKYLKSKLQLLKNKCSSLNIPVVILIAPNKSTIYPEKLPFRSPYNNKKLNELKSISPITIIECVDDIEVEKEDIKLYYKTDSHWTTYGAYLAYKRTIKELRHEGIDLKTLVKDSFLFSSTPQVMDLSTMLDLQIMENKIYAKPKMEIDTIKVIADKYIKTQTRQAPNKLNVLFLRDSFGEDVIPYFASSFSDFTASLARKIDLSIISEEDPDLVIIEIVERSIDRLKAIKG